MPNRHTDARREHDRQLSLALLRQHGSNLHAAARAIDRDPASLRERLRRLGIERDRNGDYRYFAAGPAPTSPPVPASPTFRQARAAWERSFLTRQYRAHNCNVSRMARALDVQRSALSRKLTQLGIHRPFPHSRSVAPSTAGTAPAGKRRSAMTDNAAHEERSRPGQSPSSMTW